MMAYSSVSVQSLLRVFVHCTTQCLMLRCEAKHRILKTYAVFSTFIQITDAILDKDVQYSMKIYQCGKNLTISF